MNPKIKGLVKNSSADTLAQPHVSNRGVVKDFEWAKLEIISERVD